MRLKILVAILLIFTVIFTFCACNNNDTNNKIPDNDHFGDEGEKLPDDGNEVVPPHTHSFEEWSLSVPPTCLENGIETSTCSCGESTQRYIPKLEHSFTRVLEVVDSTCTDSGYIDYGCTNGCNSNRTEWIPETGHNYVDYTNEPKCEEWGFIEHICTNCGDTYSSHHTPPIGHSYGEWISVEASFGVEGSKSRTCSICSQTETQTIPAIEVRVTYSKQGEYDVARIDRSSPGEADNYSILKIFSNFEIIGEYVDPSEIEIVYFGDNVTKARFDGGSLREVHFSDDIEYLDCKAFWVNEYLSKIYFEGDAPEIHMQALNLNGSGKARVYPTEGAKGFDGFLFGGCEVIRSWIVKEKIDLNSFTLKEYATLAAKYTDKLALDIIGLYESKNQEIFLFIPFEPDIDNFKKIKDFTLNLTKNCKTEREKIDTIYDWIVKNIEYSDPACYYTSYEVFESGRAVCAGYTTLMHDMLCAVEIPSFYTRGTTLFGNSMSVNDIFTRPDDFTTHAWLSVITSDGKVSYYDPTWGVQDPSGHKNMTAREVGEYAITYEINSLHLIVDGVDHNDFKMNDGIQFIVDGMIYSTFFGKVGTLAISEYYNYWFGFSHFDVTGDHYISEVDQPVGSIYNSGFLAELWGGDGYFCFADGLVMPIYRVAEYLRMQSLYYGEEIDYVCDFFAYKDGFIYLLHKEQGVARVAVYIGDEENVIIPAEIDGIPVDSISSNAFANNNTVKSIVISEGITTFYEGSFEGCANLEYIYIPSTYEWDNGEIMTHPLLKRCYNLKTVEISADHPHFTSLNGNVYTKDMKTLVFFAPDNDHKVFTVPESVTEIYRLAFAYSNIETVILHEGVTKIWEEAFWHSRIEYIDIPADCEIGRYCFHYATNLRRVSFADGITQLPYAAFNNCQSLKEVILPSTLTTIGDYSLAGCYTLISIDLPEGLERICFGAFVDTALVSITLPSSLTSIEYDAFLGCDSLFVINNKSTLELTPGDRDNNGGIASVVRKLNASPTSYSITVTENGLVFYADENIVILVDFLGCEGDTLILPESFEGRSYILMERCFAAHDFIGYVQRGSEIITWEDYAFHYGQQIKYLVIPATITAIPDYAFEGWAHIERIYYGGNSQVWENAFDRRPMMIDPEQIPKNDELINPDVYFYSQTKPTVDGNFWHYVNGVPTMW